MMTMELQIVDGELEVVSTHWEDLEDEPGPRELPIQRPVAVGAWRGVASALHKLFLPNIPIRF
jgi:hypothetical protein